MFPPFGSRRSIVRALCFAVAVTGIPAIGGEGDDDSLHRRIDQVVAASSLFPIENADDLTFLRRVTLDLAGRIPTIQEVRAFEADQSVDKRTRAIDRLLASDEFLRHWSNALEIMLMERRGNQHVKTDEFRAWLVELLRANKPLNEICADLVAADGTAEKQRAASAFFLERGAEPNLMAREVGRMFFGMDLQCAQCHDHPLISDYHQSDYYGLVAFVSRTSVFRPNNKQPALLGESAHGLSQFKSVFTDRESLTQPRVPDDVEAGEPYFEPGSEYKVVPGKNVRAVPKHSRRETLAEIIRGGRNERFRRNIANRVWALMLGRGIVHPVDLHHSDNPPSNPELLKLISDQFASSGFDLRWFVREIALSRVYQSAAPTVRLAASADLSVRRQQLASDFATAQKAAELASEEVEVAIGKVDEVFAKAAPLRIAWEKQQKVARDLATKRDAAEASVSAKQTAVAAKTKLRDALKASVAALKEAAVHSQDAEVSKLAEQVGKRLAKEDAGLKKLESELTKLTAARDAAQKKFDPEKPKAVAAFEKLRPMLDELRKNRSGVIASRQKLEVAATRASVLSQQMEVLDHVLESHSRRAEIAKLGEAVPVRTAALTKMTSSLAVRESEVATATGVLAEATKQTESLESRRAAVARSRDAVEKSRQLLEDAAKELRTGVGKDATIEGVAAIVQRLAVRQKSLASQAAALQRTVANSVEQASKAEQEMAALEERRSSEHEAVRKAATTIADAKIRIELLRSKQNAAREALRAATVHGFSAPVLQPLTPEQFCWSMLHATGQLDRQIAAERAKLDKKSPLKPEELKDAGKVAKRAAAAREAAL